MRIACCQCDTEPLVKIYVQSDFLTYNTVYINDIFPVVLGYWGEKCYNEVQVYFDGLVHERRNSSALAMELRVSSTKPSICLPNTGLVYKHIISAWKHRQFIDRHILSILYLAMYYTEHAMCTEPYICGDDLSPWGSIRQGSAVMVRHASIVAGGHFSIHWNISLWYLVFLFQTVKRHRHGTRCSNIHIMKFGKWINSGSQLPA